MKRRRMTRGRKKDQSFFSMSVQIVCGSLSVNSTNKEEALTSKNNNISVSSLVENTNLLNTTTRHVHENMLSRCGCSFLCFVG